MCQSVQRACRESYQLQRNCWEKKSFTSTLSIRSIAFMKSTGDDCLNTLLSETEPTRQTRHHHTHANTHYAERSTMRLVFDSLDANKVKS
ncbi:hypothetical protein E2C01_055500 [Portunus trituberculatus]|uniref:Uncharacterized protein n=1 Tax=Portunus trituberculatus TaxID=210409 RepID=A0A5B7GX03_PORTR|nr:hypothetical protein [Portunus trituberculatus]